MSLPVIIGGYLPNPFLITKPAKTAYMIYISSPSHCGSIVSGACKRRKSETWGELQGMVQAQTQRYDLDMLKFQQVDKCRSIADSSMLFELRSI
jgi:hypothetical protein